MINNSMPDEIRLEEMENYNQIKHQLNAIESKVEHILNMSPKLRINILQLEHSECYLA